MGEPKAKGRQVAIMTQIKAIVNIPDEVPKGEEVKWGFEAVKTGMEILFETEGLPFQSITTFLPSNYPKDDKG